MHGGDSEYAYGMWIVAAFNVGLFLFFMLSFLKPRGGQEWRSMGVVTAFLVALFAEMYGFPLTIFLLTGWLGDAYPVLQPFNHKLGHLWVVVFGGSTMAWAIVMGLSLALMLMGMAPILLYAYVHLARVEERRAEAEFGEAYNEYVRKTPAFFPPIKQWKAFLTVEVHD